MTVDEFREYMLSAFDFLTEFTASKRNAFRRSNFETRPEYACGCRRSPPFAPYATIRPVRLRKVTGRFSWKTASPTCTESGLQFP